MAAVSRGRYYGMLQILRYNWPQFAVTWLAAGLACVALATPRLPRAVRLALGAFVVGGVGWSSTSLAVAHYVYDLSALAAWQWLHELLPAESPARCLNLHAGVDEAAGSLPQAFPGAWHLSADFYDPRVMPEESIRRAREQDGTRAMSVAYARLPFGDASFDLVLLMFAAHELRDAAARVQLLAELKRILTPHGSVVLVEHVRDVANLLAFGPGVLHWYSPRTWWQAIDAAGLRLTSSRRITPFVRVLVASRVENPRATPTVGVKGVTH